MILDSSALMMCFEFSIDLEKELTRLLGRYCIVVPSSIVRELEFLAKTTGKKRGKAKLLTLEGGGRVRVRVEKMK